MQYSSKQVIGRKTGWKGKGRKKGKHWKRQTRWKNAHLLHKVPFLWYFVLWLHEFLSILIHWWCSGSIYETWFPFITFPVFLHSPHISVSQSKKMIFMNTWLINVWSWNSDDVWIFHLHSQPIKGSHKYHAWLIFSHIVPLRNYKNKHKYT